MTENYNNDSSSMSFFKNIYNNLVTGNQGKTVQVYSTVQEEYESLINGAGLYDLTGSAVIEMRGKDSLEYLHRISTNALKELKSGEAAVTLFTNEKGRMIDRATVLNMGEYLLLTGSQACRNKLLGWINKYIIMEDIKAADRTDSSSVFEMAGSQSRVFLSMIFGDGVDSLQSGKVLMAEVEGRKFTLVLKNEFSINKYIIISKAEDTEFLLSYMYEHKSVFDFRPVGKAAHDIFRIVLGIPEAPGEINDNYNPHEANLVSDISFTKGCYIGQEVIARLDTYNKVQKKLSLLVFDEPVESSDEPLRLLGEGGREAGVITSVAQSLKKDKSIALAYIRNEESAEGTKLTAVSPEGKAYSASICSFGLRK